MLGGYTPLVWNTNFFASTTGDKTKQQAHTIPYPVLSRSQAVMIVITRLLSGRTFARKTRILFSVETVLLALGLSATMAANGVRLARSMLHDESAA